LSANESCNEFPWKVDSLENPSKYLKPSVTPRSGIATTEPTPSAWMLYLAADSAGPEKELGTGNGAGGEDRTPDLRFTKPLHYRCATPAFGISAIRAS
jgi:hypothetical protein